MMCKPIYHLMFMRESFVGETSSPGEVGCVCRREKEGLRAKRFGGSPRGVGRSISPPKRKQVTGFSEGLGAQFMKGAL